MEVILKKWLSACIEWTTTEYSLDKLWHRKT